MPRNGSGAYSPPAGQPVVGGTTVSSSVFNALVTDLGAEMTKSVCTDGQTPMTANLQMGGFKLTNLGAASNAGDAVQLSQMTDAIAAAVASYLTSAAAAATYLPLAGGMLTGPLKLPDGSAANPALCFASDPDTGFYRVSAGVIGITINGVLAATVAASGIVSDDFSGPLP